MPEMTREEKVEFVRTALEELMKAPMDILQEGLSRAHTNLMLRWMIQDIITDPAERRQAKRATILGAWRFAVDQFVAIRNREKVRR